MLQLGTDTQAMKKLALGPDASQLCCDQCQLIHLAAQKNQKQRAVAHVEIQTACTKTSERPLMGKAVALKEAFQQKCTSRDLPSTGTGIVAKEKSLSAGANIIDWAEKKSLFILCLQPRIQQLSQSSLYPPFV